MREEQFRVIFAALTAALVASLIVVGPVSADETTADETTAEGPTIDANSEESSKTANPTTSSGPAVADSVLFYVNNPTGNSADWTNAVTDLGGVVNTNVNLNAHPLGELQSDFYLASDGVTITSNATGGIVYGAGPGQVNTGTAPGEGLHASSNYLRSAPSLTGVRTATTISFPSDTIGAGLFTIDFFNSGAVMTLEAYDGVDGTGNLLGSATAARHNFQRNKLYFMGVADPGSAIRSIVLTHDGGMSDVIGLDDIRFATVPEPSSLVLLATGAIGLLLHTRRRRR